MMLINTDGMAFIGPGSEWFWTALTGVVLAITFVGIYRQLRVQVHASAAEQLAEFRHEAYSEERLRAGLDVMIALRDHDDPADVPDAAVLGIGDYWENIAILARTGHQDVKLLWQIDSASPQINWAWVAPWAGKVRIESRFGLPTYHNLEWLAGVMAEMDRKAGKPVIDTTIVVRHIEPLISLQEELIRYAQASRAAVAAPRGSAHPRPSSAPAAGG